MAEWTEGFPYSIGEESLSDILFDHIPPLELDDISDIISGTIPLLPEIQNDISFQATLHQCTNRKALVIDTNGKIMTYLNEAFHIFFI